MKKRILFAFLLSVIVYAGCGSSNKDKPAYRSSADTTSSEINTPPGDTLIKDTVMSDSTGNMDGQTATDRNKRGRKSESANP